MSWLTGRYQLAYVCRTTTIITSICCLCLLQPLTPLLRWRCQALVYPPHTLLQWWWWCLPPSCHLLWHRHHQHHMSLTAVQDTRLLLLLLGHDNPRPPLPRQLQLPPQQPRKKLQCCQEMDEWWLKCRLLMGKIHLLIFYYYTHRHQHTHSLNKWMNEWMNLHFSIII